MNQTNGESRELFEFVNAVKYPPGYLESVIIKYKGEIQFSSYTYKEDRFSCDYVEDVFIEDCENVAWLKQIHQSSLKEGNVFFIDDTKELFDLYVNKQITIGKLTELLNEKCASQSSLKEKESVLEELGEKEVMIHAFDNVRSLFESRSWIMDGRGSYPYNDDRYKEEVRYLYDEFDDLKKEVWKNIKTKTFEYREKIIADYKSSLTPKSISDSELLPCPFCGKEPEWINLKHPSGIPALKCFECQFEMQQDRRDKTIFYWNRRASLKPNKITDSDIEKIVEEKDLIIEGIIEGSEQWKAEYDNCRAVLQELVELKSIKDSDGKTDEYLHRQPKAWEDAVSFLSKYQHS